MKLHTVKTSVLTGMLTACILSLLGAKCAVGAPESDAKGQSVTPEVKLIDDFNNWYFARILDKGWVGDLENLRAGLPKYITEKTVLNEPLSLPWGGTKIGYDGWLQLTKEVTPVMAKLGPLTEVTKSTDYQQGNVVLRHLTLALKPTKQVPEPFVFGIVEKYTIENGRIVWVDVFYTDTAQFLERLAALDAIPERKTEGALR